MPFLALIIFFAAVSLAIWRFPFAVLLVVAGLPLYVIRFSFWGFPTTALELLLLAAVFVGLGRALKERRFWKDLETVRELWPWINLLLLASIIALFVAPSLYSALGQWKALILEPLLFFIVATPVLREASWRRNCVRVLACSGVIISIWAIIQFATGWGIPEAWSAWEVRRAVAIYSYPNAIGLALAPVVMLMLGFVFSKGRAITRGMAGVSAMLMIVGLAVAKVEGAFVGLLAGVLFFSFFTSRRVWVWGGAGLILIVLFIIPLTRDYVWSLLTFQDVSGEVRLALWQGSFALLMDHPFVGSGLAGFQQLYDQYRLARHTELLLYPHNVFLNFWSELGLLGLIAMIALIKIFFQTGLSLVRERGSSPLVFGLLSSMVVMLVYGLVEVPFFKNDLAVLWWLWFALLWGVKKTTSRIEV